MEPFVQDLIDRVRRSFHVEVEGCEASEINGTASEAMLGFCGDVRPKLARDFVRFGDRSLGLLMLGSIEEVDLADDATVQDGAAAVASDAGGEVAALRARLLQSELRTAAVKAGILDVDAIKLVDLSTVKTTDAGELVDGVAVMRTLRAAKPYLFGSNSSSVAVAPRVASGEVKPAMAMSTEEWRKARSELLRRR